MNHLAVEIALLLALAGSPRTGETLVPPTTIRDALGRALPLIQKGNAGHLEKRTCFACHHQAVPLLALSTARSRGLSIDEELFQKNLRAIAGFLDKNRDNYQKGQGQGGQVDTAGYALWTLQIGRWEPDPTTAAVAEYLLLRDTKLDHWRTTSDRPPSEVSPFTTTYVALRGLDGYATAQQQDRVKDRFGQVRAWLMKATAKDTEDRVFRLRALKLTRADDADLHAATADLVKLQRDDGGWSQKDSLASDAYATGSVLVALHDAGDMPTGDPAFQRGIKYLLKTQREDGSWHVASRSKPFQLYFESGFPHGKDQFISIAASSWAATALALGLQPVKDPQPKARPKGH
jgi:Squalene-hopene cyclase C-terminal domain